MGSIPAKGCQLSRVLTTVVIVLTLSMTVHPSDVTTGAIGYDDMTINWRIEIIDEGPHIVPGMTSTAVDPSGGVHVSYHDAVADGLRYAYRPADGNWTSQLIDSPGVGNASAIGVDSKGAVHIAYEDRIGGALKYAIKQPAGNWSVQVVDPGPGTGGSPTLDIDALGQPFITCLNRSVPSIMMATPGEGGGWNISSIINGEETYGGEPDLAIGTNGSMHLVYLAGDLDSPRLDVHYAYKWPGEGWRKEMTPCQTDGSSHLSIALDNHSLPHVVVDGNSSLLSWDSWGRWEADPYFEDARIVSYGDIRYDSKGLWLVCGRTALGYMRFFQTTPVGTSRTGIVAGWTEAGLRVSMEVGPDDRHHVVYYDEASGRLGYATDADRPSVPVGLTATGGEQDVLLEWGTPAHLGNATSLAFDIYRRGPDYYSFELFRTGWTGNSFRDTSVHNKELYSYIVVAVNGAGEGDFSDVVSARPVLHPTMPLHVTATSGPDNVVLRWDPPKDPGVDAVTAYRIYWRSGNYWDEYGPEWHYPVSEWSNVTVDGSARTFNHTGLLHGLIYHYKIVAMHADGEGETAFEVSATPMVPAGPPIALAARRGDGRVVLNWTRPADDGGCRLTAYNVYRGTSPFDLRLLTTINGSAGKPTQWFEPSMTLVDNGTVPEAVGWGKDWGQDYLIPKDAYEVPGKLEDNVTYYYQVSAVQLMGEGPRSPVLEVPLERTQGTSGDLNDWVVPIVILSIIIVGTVLVVAAMRSRAGRRERRD